MEYADFEGVIPKGQYGAGAVMLWDTGTYDTDGSAAEQLKRGELKFTLHGQKLKGGFVLIRTGRGSVTVRAPWLLIKRRDKHAVRSWNIDRYDWSVLTGRSLQEIKTGGPRAAATATKGGCLDFSSRRRSGITQRAIESHMW